MSKKMLIGQRGMITPVILIILAVFLVSATAIIGWSLSERKDVTRKVRNTKALQVAEAGIEYYKWHLAHNSEDFQNGEDWCCDYDPSKSLQECGGVCGPYTEIYKDYDGNEIGEFQLSIVHPSVGSTISEITSVGRIYDDGGISKSVTAKIGKMSLARYSLLSDSPIWIGPNESTSGPLHSNAGIRFDGSCDAEVTSAVETYDGSSARHGFTGTRPGIWGAADEYCQQYWSFPEPEIDFDLFTLSMASIKSASQVDGIYLAPSGKGGYHLVFSGDAKVTIYEVESTGQQVKYYNDNGVETTDMEGIKKETLIGTYNMPYNGLIFVEDDLWVEGEVNGRVTVAASRFTENPSNYARIVINDLLYYVARDGSNVLGLMAEGDILIPRHAPTEMVLDAVMLSQKGHVFRRNYKSSYVAKRIEVYGGIITDLYWTWGWVDSQGNNLDGYKETITIYDSHLTFSPPPFFPTEENFEVISWRENR